MRFFDRPVKGQTTLNVIFYYLTNKAPNDTEVFSSSTMNYQTTLNEVFATLLLKFQTTFIDFFFFFAILLVRYQRH